MKKPSETTTLTAQKCQEAIEAFADPELRTAKERFFKTKPGEYGHGDEFIGVKVPQVRACIKSFQAMDLAEIEKMISSPIHEFRQAGAFLLVFFARKNPQKAFDTYLKHLDLGHINNWDIVDGSAPQIVGWHLSTALSQPTLCESASANSEHTNIPDPMLTLTSLAQHPGLWHRRVAMVATQGCLKKGFNQPAVTLAALLLGDSEDLIHKAVGWTLREMVKTHGEEPLREFLTAHASTMPRTMLRYATEKFEATERKSWLAR